MPITNAGMSAAIKAQLDAKFPITVTAEAGTWRQDFADTIAAAIVTYLKANALIPVVHPMGPGKGTIT